MPGVTRFILSTEHGDQFADEPLPETTIARPNMDRADVRRE